MCKSKVIITIYAFLAAATVEAFLPSSSLTKKTFSTANYAFSDGGDREEYENALLNNKKRTCIQHFLSQRSFQSFMTLLREVRDPHSSDWIERFLEAPSLLEYHGTGAFNMTRFDTWDSYFLEMAKNPNERLIIQSRRNSASAMRGGSKNNPFLKDDRDHHVETILDINPSSLVTRIISVREQIAREFIIDFDLIRTYNDQILETYEYRVKNKRKMRVDCCFERNAMIILENNMAMAEFASSPIRKGTFDLLLLLSLHESIHRVLRYYQDIGQDREVSFEWLSEYFTDRVEDFFDGYQHYGRADDFIEELLMTAPTVRNTVEGTALVDPQKVASDIIKMRSEVLLDWIDVMKNAPEDHESLKQIVLFQQTKGWAADIASDAVVPSERDIGAFE